MSELGKGGFGMSRLSRRSAFRWSSMMINIFAESVNANRVVEVARALDNVTPPRLASLLGAVVP